MLAAPRPSRVRRWTAVGALALLSGITGYISYLHGYEIAILTGNPKSVAYWLPLVPDLMIVTSSMTLLEARATTGGRPWTAMVALVAGIGWTVAQNVAAGLHDSPGNALLSAGVPLAFVMTFESLLWQFRRDRNEGHYENHVTSAGQIEPPALDVADTLSRLVAHFGSERAAASALRMSRDRLRDLLRQPEPVAEPVAVNGNGSHG